MCGWGEASSKLIPSVWECVRAHLAFMAAGTIPLYRYFGDMTSFLFVCLCTAHVSSGWATSVAATPAAPE